jgi:hypothetical protein
MDIKPFFEILGILFLKSKYPTSIRPESTILAPVKNMGELN